MPTSSVAQILLRLFAVNWLLTGAIQIASLAFTVRQEYFTILSLAPSAVYFFAGVTVWIISPKLSQRLARRNDGEFDFRGVTVQQLYSAVFLGLGLYFALCSFATAFSWIHFFTVNSSPEYGFLQGNQPSYYDMTEKVMTLIAGIILVMTCNTWAEKIAHKQSSKRDADGQPAARPDPE